MNRTSIKLAAAVLMLLIVFVWIGTAKKPAEKTLHFDHALHAVDNGLACEDCHSGMNELAAGERSMPDHGTCEMCHIDAIEGDCSYCHVNPDEPMPAAPVQGMYEGFAHMAHGELDCSACHGDIEATRMEPALPGMTSCQDCHLAQSGPLECGECHNGMEPVPADHELATWHEDHGLEASASSSDCAMCHTQASCDECHQGENIYGTPHQPHYVWEHAQDALFSGECLACHETRDDCITCHRSMLPVPHPFGTQYANITNGGAHVDEASAFIEACMACHDVGAGDPTCARCHE